jgi:hypothetical protein
MRCDCSVDVVEEPTLYRETWPRARRLYMCCECGDKIHTGEQYQCTTGLWEDEWATYRTCMLCAKIRTDYCAWGWEYGQLAEALWECLEVEL